MTTIKCRYKEKICTHPCSGIDKVEWDDMWFCDDSQGCEYYTRPKDAPKNLANPMCEYVDFEKHEFARQVKEYEYTEDDELFIPKWRGNRNLFIDGTDINYLSIDGRVLVEGTEEDL